MVPFLECVHLNAGYLREQFLVPFYFLLTSTICQRFDFVPTATLHCIDNALIQSQFDYCNIVWDNGGKLY